jgi:GAF domain
MPTFQISRSGRAPVQVIASNWLGAIGRAAEIEGIALGLDQLVCEVVSTSSVVVMDLGTGWPWHLEEVPRSGNFDGTSRPPVLSRSAPSASAPAPPVARRTAFSPPSSIDAAADSDGSHFESVDDMASEDSGGFALDLDVGTEKELQSIEQAPSATLAWSLALDHALRRVPSEGGAAVMVNAVGGLWFVDTAGPRGQQLRGIVLPQGTGLVGQCIASRKAFMVDDARHDKRFFPQMDNLTQFRTRAVLCVPVQQTGTLYGALELLNPMAPRTTYDAQALAAVEGVAAVLAARLAAGRS